MVQNYKCMGVCAIIVLLNLGLNAQILRWQGMPETAAESSLKEKQNIDASKSPFPVYNHELDPKLANERFLSMVNAWNTENPTQVLQASQIDKLRADSHSAAQVQRELQIAANQKAEADRLNPAFRAENNARAILNAHGLAHVWGLPGMPTFPKTQQTDNPEEYTKWLYAVRAWIEMAQAPNSGTDATTNKSSHANTPNPNSIPLPIYIDTGDPAYDSEIYHQQKLKYSQQLSRQQNQE